MYGPYLAGYRYLSAVIPQFTSMLIGDVQIKYIYNSLLCNCNSRYVSLQIYDTPMGNTLNIQNIVFIHCLLHVGHLQLLFKSRIKKKKKDF